MNLRRLHRPTMLVFFIILTLVFCSQFYGSGQPDSDFSPPEMVIEFGGTLLEQGGNTWISNTTIIWLNASDPSGVAFLNYKIWRDSDADGGFEGLEKEVTVFNDSDDDLDPSRNITTTFTINTSCRHKIEYYGVDTKGNVPAEGHHQLQEEWNYSYQPIVTHCYLSQSILGDQYRKMVFGSSAAAMNLLPDVTGLEIVCGSDETQNVYPETDGAVAEGGIWRCWSAAGDIQWAKLTGTDEARSSPAICDINEDGFFEIAAGTTSGWNVEVIDSVGNFSWTFPHAQRRGGQFCWHSSPALADIVDDNPNLAGLELVIGNNPNHNVWCFDGDNSDGKNDGISIKYSDFPNWTYDINNDGKNTKADFGIEGKDWDVLWIFDNNEPFIASPAVADVDDDSEKEVVIGSLDGHLYVIDGATGVGKWNYATGGAIYSSAALANLDEDDQLEIVVGSNDQRVYCFDGTGYLEWSFKTKGAIYSSPSVGDVDGDGELEIVFGSHDHNIYCLNATGDTPPNVEWVATTGGRIYSSPAFSEVPPFSATQWPMFRHDCSRTGFFENTFQVPLHIFIGSNDSYLYKISGVNGSIVSRFQTHGPIHTSPTVADVDRDGAVEVLFYDWGDEANGKLDDFTGTNDTFWCLEEPYYILTNETIVMVDTLSPAVDKRVGNPNVTVKAGEEYYVTTATPITIDGHDEGCGEMGGVGIEKIEYRIWFDGAWLMDWTEIEGGETITFERECTHYLEIRITDQFGNVVVDNETFHVDDTPPAATKEIGHPRYGQDDEFVTTSTLFYINTSDVGACAAGSRRLNVQVHRDDNQDHIFQNPEERVLSLNVLDNSVSDNNPTVGVINVTISFSQECYHRIRWRAEDLLLNLGAWHNQYHYADDTPPTGTFDVGDPNCELVPGEEYCVTTGSPLWINVTDEGATAECTVGDYVLHWALWNESGLYDSDTHDHSNATLSIGEECNHTVGYWTEDALGNRWPATGYHNITLHVDEKAPLVGISVGEPNCSEAPNGGYCVTTDTPITIDAHDQGCCPGMTVTYRIWNNTYDAGWQTISMPYTFTFEEQCRHNLSVRAFDCLGNLVYKNITFYVDDIAPVITKTVGQPSQADIMGADFSIATTTPITIDASPGCCPNMSVAYRIDDGEWIPTAVPATNTFFSTEGYHTLDIRASDCLGHVSYDNETFYVEKYAPLLNIEKTGPGTANAGDTIEYVITYNNTGTATATNVWVNDTLDGDVTYHSAWPSPTNDSGGNPVTWYIGDLEPGQNFTILLNVSIITPIDDGTLIANYVEINAGNADPADDTHDTVVTSTPVLDIEKTGPGTANAGDTIQYTIEVTNTGDQHQLDNEGDELQDEIPGHAAFVDGSLTWSSGAAVYDAGNDMVRWNGRVDVGDTVIIRFNVTIDLPLDNGTWVNNTAYLFWDSNGDNTNDATSNASANLSVVSSPDLSLEKTDMPDPVMADSELDSELIYRIWVNNSGNANATNVVVQESYPPGTTFVSATPQPLSPDGETWHFSHINVSESKLIKIHVDVGPMPNGSVLLNEVNVTCDQGVDNETTEETTVLTEPVLLINKTVSSAVVEQGGSITYSIVVSNTGTAPATSVIVQDIYDPVVTFAGAWPEPTSGNNLWDLGELAAGASKTITVQVDNLTEFEEGTTIVNYVNVTCAEGKEDQDWANASITSEPPDTWKVFHGIVHNVTYYRGEGYLIHYITDDTTITLKAIDLPRGAGSGVEHTYYRIFKWNDKAGKWGILFNWKEYSVWKTKQPYDPIDLYELGLIYGKTPCGKYQIEFYSVDEAGNFEGMEWNDVVVDCSPPTSAVQPLPPVVENESVTVSATASDDAAVANVTLWYRYSEDNETWTDWIASGTKTKPYTWEFTPPEGDGFYQFYSVATDYVGHAEAVPDASTTPDAWCEFTYAPWDVNNDGSVNILDVSFVADHWMETPVHPDWNPAADVNGDGKVNIMDIMLIAEHWTG